MAIIPRTQRRPAGQPSALPSLPADFGQSNLGQQFAEAGSAIGQAMGRIESRQNAVSRARDENAYNDFAAQSFQATTTTGDISDPQVVRQYNEGLIEKQREILSSHRGTRDSRLQLQEKLERQRGSFMNQMAQASVQAGLKAVQETAGQELNQVLAGVRENPSNIEGAFEDYANKIFDLSEALDPDTTRSLLRAGVEQIVETGISQPLMFGDADGAEEILDNNPSAVVMMGPEAENRIRGKITAARQQQAKTQRDIQVAVATERAKLMARREFVQDTLQAVGLGPPPGTPEATGDTDPPAVATPFGEGEASGDARDVARLFTASRKLLLAGEQGLATQMLGQARFLAENSPEIQRQKELDKPISESLASEFGVPAGTTLREVMTQIPRSPEEQAQSTAVARERGKQQIAGEEQIAFIDEARATVTDLLDDISADPGIVGAQGSLRAKGQTALGVMGDLGMDALVQRARDTAFSQTELSLDETEGFFDDSNLSVLKVIENSLGLILARLRTPGGRIPVDVIKRSIDDVKLTGFTSSEQVQNRLSFVLQQLDRRAQAIESRFDLPGQSETEESDIPTFRVQDGKLVPAGGE